MKAVSKQWPVRLNGIRSFSDGQLLRIPRVQGSDDGKDRRVDPFHVHRQLDNGAGFSRSKKEQMIFTSLLESIFEQKTVGENKSAGKVQKMPQSLQMLFQQSLNPDKSAGSNDVQMEMVNEDLRKVPLSSSSLIHRMSGQTPLQVAKDEREQLTRQLGPVLQYISNLETDMDVQEYYMNNILNKVAISGPLENYEVDENTHIDPNAPPLTKKTVPIYLYHVLDTLDEAFHAPEQVITLFELSKRSGIDFYVSACTVDVYNKILQVRWKYYRDLYAVESLLSEMNVNAVLGNEETVKIIGKIHGDYLEAKYGVSDENLLTLWNKEDSKRLKNINQYRMRIISSSSDDDLLQLSI
ncbi:hypothetical protein TRICI_005407 [Trichomonascus ciferrii]|uniref:Mtf2-like C-terminal domain-containing protein n=1 Tax=Trichomonascus ciferrii TaxID=44093 RepID=A0A642USU7_9ASCO|nr:hypothetical protein TRICI_005407 [Trichomonascus ciferrii]